MEDIILNLIVIAVVAVLVIALFLYLQQRKKRRDHEFRQMVQEKGWQVERVQQPLLTGYKLFGKDAGSQWTLETLAQASPREAGPGSSEVSHSTRWWTEDITLPDNAIVFGPGTGPDTAKMFNSFGAIFLQKALQVMLGKDAQWAARLSPVEINNPALREKFLIMAEHNRGVDQLLSVPVENVLSALSEKHKVIVTLRNNGLEIRLPEEQVMDRQTLEQIVNLGKTIALSLPTSLQTY